MDWRHPFGQDFGTAAAKNSAPVVTTEPAPTPETETAMPTLRALDPTPPADSPFADWVLRPDCNGRLGWEAPGLPEEDRWWARAEFDDLPTYRNVPRVPHVPHDTCYWCGRSVFWRSIHGVVVCGNCHPPAIPSLVAEWIGGPSAIPLRNGGYVTRG